jgi:osmotically-inducible protein OsmY
MYRVAFLVVAVAMLVAHGPVRAHANEMDARVESSAKQSYVFKTYLKDDAITIQSTDGVVVLTGKVVEESHKALAQETVASLPGVKSVDNRLELTGERAAENSDLWVRMNVQASLLYHRHLSVSKTEVEVKGGVVTLRGEAANSAQIDLTTAYVKDVEGVKSVHNEMTVAKVQRSWDKKSMVEKIGAVGESIDDASITALVKMTLIYHRSTSVLHTKVTTSKGVVTLEGKARNASEKDLVTKFAQDVYGVNNVVNNMAITEPGI